MKLCPNCLRRPAIKLIDPKEGYVSYACGVCLDAVDLEIFTRKLKGRGL